MENKLINYNQAREQIITKPNNSIVIFTEYLSEKYLFGIKGFIRKVMSQTNKNNQIYYIGYGFENKELKICEELNISKNLLKSEKLLSEKEFLQVVEQLKSLKAIKFTDFSYFGIEPKVKTIDSLIDVTNSINLGIEKETSIEDEIKKEKINLKIGNPSLKINKLRLDYEKFLEFYFSIKNENSKEKKEYIVKKTLNTAESYIFEKYIMYKETNNLFTVIKNFITSKETNNDFAIPVLENIVSFEQINKEVFILKNNKNEQFLEYGNEFILKIPMGETILNGKVKIKGILPKEKYSLFNSVFNKDSSISSNSTFFILEYKNKEYILCLEYHELNWKIKDKIDSLKVVFVQDEDIIKRTLEDEFFKKYVLRYRTTTFKNVKVNHYKNYYGTGPLYLHEGLNPKSIEKDNEELVLYLNGKQVSCSITNLHFREGGLEAESIQEYGYVPLLSGSASWKHEYFGFIYIKVNNIYYLFNGKLYYMGATEEDITKLPYYEFTRKNNKFLNNRLAIIKKHINPELGKLNISLNKNPEDSEDLYFYKDLLDKINSTDFFEETLSVNKYNW